MSLYHNFNQFCTFSNFTPEYAYFHFCTQLKDAYLLPKLPLSLLYSNPYFHVYLPYLILDQRVCRILMISPYEVVTEQEWMYCHKWCWYYPHKCYLQPLKHWSILILRFQVQPNICYNLCIQKIFHKHLP